MGIIGFILIDFNSSIKKIYTEKNHVVLKIESTSPKGSKLN